MLNKKLILGLSMVTILVSVAILGYNLNKTTVPIKSVPVQTQKNSENSDIKDTTTSKPETDTPASVTATVPLSQFKYDISSIPDNTKIELNTPWESSPLGKLSATIEGKGEKAQEEGYSHIIIKDVQSGKLTKLTLENEEKNQITAKDLEWIDESNMFVIIGQAFGTISQGGKIYKVNITTGETSLYVNTTSSKEEFTAVHKTANGYTFEKYVYDDANFIKGHSESGTLELK
jgi:hypothetical protein